jgi:DNA-binding transcriptional regulator GbsR (MarR family)
MGSRAMPRPASAAKSTASASAVSGREAASVAFERALVAFFEETTDLLGVPKSVAAIYAVIFASSEPVSFAEIEARLDLSKGSVSQGLRVLREVGAVREVSAKADPVERFSPDLEMRQLIARFLESRIETQLKTGRGRLEALGKQLAALPPTERKILTPRLHKLENWHTRSRRLLPVIRTFLKVG